MSIRFESNVEPVPGYRLIERIGSGGFGEVWKCEAPGGIFKAVKIIHGDLRSKDNDLVRYAEQELKALKRVKMVRHPYLLALDRYDIVDGRLLIVMELADCNLWEKYREHRLKGRIGIPRDELMLYMTETAEVLDLMNFEHQLLHLDIKPQNIFLQYKHVKVGDFGQVKDLEGLVASVTGGITPVYAAPETFDGVVTRYCDQYSLACVYQELLTGQRPFDGTSMQQLLMQHLTMPPNLNPSPAADRGALAKALSKKSEDRFANCGEFVRALQAGMPLAVPVGPPVTPTVASAAQAIANLLGSGSSHRIEVAMTDTNSSASGSAFTAPIAAHEFAATPLPDESYKAVPSRLAPPVQTGDGPIRPALIIGLGAAGLNVCQRLRKLLVERYTTASAVPAVRTLFIDTDPETLAAALVPRPWEGLAALKPDELYAARLTRASHYIKPRPTGRPMIEGWFDQQLLHKRSRLTTTGGIRAFGRLALVDHFRALVQKIDADLESCLTPEALAETVKNTGQSLASNRPRVYVVAGLAGGTGSGMCVDLGFIIQHKLRKLGYANPDVVGVFFVPPDDPLAEYGPQARANVYAALTELNHFARPETIYQSYFDDRHTIVRDGGPAFPCMYLLPATPLAVPALTPVGAGTLRTTRSGGQKAVETSRTYSSMSSGVTQAGTLRTPLRALAEVAADDALAIAADWLRLDLFGPLARSGEAVRATLPPGGVGATVRTFGLVKHHWPRAEIVAHTAKVVAGVVLDHWVSTDINRARVIIPGWAERTWQRLGLDTDGFLERLTAAANGVLGGPVEQRLLQLAETAMPRGWLSRQPDPSQLLAVMGQFDQWLGHPVSAATRTPTHIEEATRAAAADLATAAQVELAALLPRMIDDPQFRLAGAEEGARQLLADTTRKTAALTAQADRLDEEARLAYECLAAHAHQTKTNRAATAASPADALKQYPRARFQAILARRVARTYAALKEVLGTARLEIASCRSRLQAFHSTLLVDLEEGSPWIGARQVMPPGCGAVEEAAKRYLAVLTDDDLQQLEEWVQAGIERSAGGLYEACLNSADGADGLLKVIREQSRAYLNVRLGDVDLAAMFESKYGPTAAVADAFRTAFQEATPTLVGAGPWTRQGFTIFAAPAGDSGDALRHAAHLGFPREVATIDADTADETIVYREYSHVPLNTLPHFGPVWTAAYDGAPETLHCNPHTRTDVPRWIGVDND